MTDGILEVFKLAGLDQPDLSALSGAFLAEVRETKKENLVVETQLSKICNDKLDYSRFRHDER